MRRLISTLFLFTAFTCYSAGTVDDGLRQALTIGAENATAALAKPDAYYRSAFRIPFPPEAKPVADTLQRLGMGSLVDKIELSLNRAAENSAAQAKPIFLDAIRAISLGDAWQILRGPATAATEYLRGHTRDRLVAAYRPAVQNSLDKVDATRYWGQAMSVYNKVPFVQKVSPDLAGYVTGRALDAVFVKVGEEEKRIRQNPAARVTSLLKDVFGRAGR